MMEAIMKVVNRSVKYLNQEIFFKGNLMVLVFLNERMASDIMDSGETASLMGKGMNIGQMDQ